MHAAEDRLRVIPHFLGVSGTTAQARGLSLNLVVVPPGGKAEPHTHSDFESAIYVISGRAIHHWGETVAGDFLYIAPGADRVLSEAATRACP